MHFPALRSIKTRVTFSTLTIFVVSIWILTYSASVILQQDMEKLLGEQQLSTVTVAAEAVDDDFSNRMQALQDEAYSLDARTMANPAAVQAKLVEWRVLQQMFNGGMLVTDDQGTAIAEYPTSPQRVGVNYMERDYIRKSLFEGKATVGSPVVGKKVGAPVIAMSVPIRDAQGRVIGSLNGVTNLSAPNFLDKITQGQYGQTGGYILVDPKSRLILTATDKRRIMELLPPTGVNPYVDRNIAGYEGYSVLVNAIGEEQMASVKQIPAAGWYILLGTPTAEAFAPIRNLQMRLFLATLLLTLFAAWTTWGILKYQLAPLVGAANAITQLTQTHEIPLPLPMDSDDEIGKVVRGFNRLIETWTQRENALTQGKEKLELAASVFTHALEGIFIADSHHTIVDVNGAFSRMTGYTRTQAVGQSTSLIDSGRHSAEFFSDLERCVAEQGYWYGELWIRRQDGELFPALQTISVVRSPEGSVQYYVAFVTDITERKEYENQLEHIAHFDALTNLPNRTLLADRMQQAMAQVRRRQLHLAVVYLDLDGFKNVNDRHGHDSGDAVLVAVAVRMKQALREGDTLARIGGDEFVAILNDLENQDACTPLIQRLLTAASTPVELADARVAVSASLGVSFFPQPEDIDADQILRQADQAMYMAKVAGKNRYQIFDAAKDHSLRDRLESLVRIDQALLRGELVLYYQPKVNLQSGVVVGAEALIRWNHPDQGLLAPGQFLPVIENHALDIAVGEWVIGQALSQLTQWRQHGLDLPVSVNIGPYQLQQKDFLTRLQTLLDAHPEVPAGHLELEVLETSALDDISQVSKVIEACTALGVDFALDDFGTGYSSLTYLKRLRVKTLKIDQSFVRDMLEDADDLAILQGVIGLAAAFKRQVIAEGVETAAHGRMLRALGCDLVQGYGIARPMPAEQIPEWVAAWRLDRTWTV